MDAQQIESVLDAEQFEPFRIELASGDRCDVVHPASVFIQGRQLVIVDRVNAGRSAIRSIRTVDAQLVSKVTPLRQIDGRPVVNPVQLPSTLAPSLPFVDWCESILSLLCVSLICVLAALSGVGIFIVIGRGDISNDIMAIVGCAAVMVIELLLLSRLFRFYAKRLYPLPLLYALAFEPPKLQLARWVIAAFWLAHGILGILAFSGLELLFAATTNTQVTRHVDQTVPTIISLIFVSAGVHASMMFFLLTTRALGATPRLVRILWRFRVLIDVAVVGAVEGIALQMPRLWSYAMPTVHFLRQTMRQ